MTVKVHVHTLCSKKNCITLFLQQHCQFLQYWNNYWYTYTLINMPQRHIQIVNRF